MGQATTQDGQWKWVTEHSRPFRRQKQEPRMTRFCGQGSDLGAGHRFQSKTCRLQPGGGSDGKERAAWKQHGWGWSRHQKNDNRLWAPFAGRLLPVALASLPAPLDNVLRPGQDPLRALGRSLKVQLFMDPIYAAGEISPQQQRCPGTSPMSGVWSKCSKSAVRA